MSPNCRWVHIWPCANVLCTSACLFCYFGAVTVCWCWGNNSNCFCAFVNWAAICHYLIDFKWVWAPPVLVVKFTLSGLRRRSFSIRKMLPLCYNNAWSALKYGERFGVTIPWNKSSGNSIELDVIDTLDWYKLSLSSPPWVRGFGKLVWILLNWSLQVCSFWQKGKYLVWLG